MTLDDPGEAMSLFFDGNATQFVGTGLWLKRAATGAGTRVSHLLHLDQRAVLAGVEPPADSTPDATAFSAGGQAAIAAALTCS
ncbi:MAG: hypothetical protein ACREKS_02870, partial [Candidatus Rokuibacteriota bacterium]